MTKLRHLEVNAGCRGRNTKFQCFAKTADCVDVLNSMVQEFIEENERIGFKVDHKTVHVEGSVDNSIKPTIVITVWMVQEWEQDGGASGMIPVDPGDRDGR